MGLNIIGDIAGRKDEFDLLREKMPKDKFLLVGDLNDRGPKSKEVIQWCIDNNAIVLQSNHGDMFVDFYEGRKKYHPVDFLKNGGINTIGSYIPGWFAPSWMNHLDRKYFTHSELTHIINESVGLIELLRKEVPKEHIEYLKNLPFYYREEGLFVSHAAWHPRLTLEQVCQSNEYSMDNSIIWSRYKPREREGMLQVFGHNSCFEWYGENRRWAVCIDDSKNNKLTGLHWPSLQVFQQDYLD